VGAGSGSGGGGAQTEQEVDRVVEHPHGCAARSLASVPAESLVLLIRMSGKSVSGGAP